MKEAELKKYTREELYKGMKIKDKKQLSNIYDTWIFLIKEKGKDSYEIGFIGDRTNKESDSLFSRGVNICPVYNDSSEIEGDIYYEE